MDEGISSDHALGQGVSGGVGVEAAVDGCAGGNEIHEPRGIGTDASGGDTAVTRMENQATEGVDGRFAEDYAGWCGKRAWPWGEPRHGEHAQVFLRTRGHPPPWHGTGAAQFGSHRFISLSKEQEDGVGAVVSVKNSRTDERLDQIHRQCAFNVQVAFDALQMKGLAPGQSELWFLGRRRIGRAERA